MKQKRLFIAIIAFLVAIVMILLFAIRKELSPAKPNTSNARPRISLPDTAKVVKPKLPVVGDVSICLPGDYRDEPLAKYKKMEKETWYGLIKEGHNFYLKRTRVFVKMSMDACIGYKVPSVMGDDDYIVLVKGITPLASKLRSIDPQDVSIPVNKSWSFQWEGKSYKLFATGEIDRSLGISATPDTAMSEEEIRGLSEDDFWNHTRYYQLYLACNEKRPQKVLECKGFYDTKMEVIWVGDMDYDNKPDFLFSTPSDYEIREVRLFLSSKAKKGLYIGYAGTSFYNFDC